MTIAQFAWSEKPLRAEPPPAYAKGNKQKIEAYVVLLRLRHDLYLRWKESGKWPDDKEANAALAAHGEYWAKQLGEGRAVLAGGMKGDYWDNVALIVFEAESEEQAQKIVKADPAVKAYVFQAQVRPGRRAGARGAATAETPATRSNVIAAAADKPTRYGQGD